MTGWEIMFWTGCALAAISVLGVLAMRNDDLWVGYAVVGVVALVLMWAPILSGNLS